VSDATDVSATSWLYFLVFFACRFSFSVFCAGFFSMAFFVFLSLLAMPVASWWVYARLSGVAGVHQHFGVYVRRGSAGRIVARPARLRRPPQPREPHRSLDLRAPIPEESRTGTPPVDVLLVE